MSGPLLNFGRLAFSTLSRANTLIFARCYSFSRFAAPKPRNFQSLRFAFRNTTMVATEEIAAPAKKSIITPARTVVVGLLTIGIGLYLRIKYLAEFHKWPITVVQGLRLAKMEESAGNLDKAEFVLVKLIIETEKECGSKSPTMMFVYDKISRFYERQKLFNKAIMYQFAILSILKELGKPLESLAVMVTTLSLVDLLTANKNYEYAMNLLNSIEESAKTGYYLTDDQLFLDDAELDAVRYFMGLTNFTERPSAEEISLLVNFRRSLLHFYMKKEKESCESFGELISALKVSWADTLKEDVKKLYFENVNGISNFITVLSCAHSACLTTNKDLSDDYLKEALRLKDVLLDLTKKRGYKGIGHVIALHLNVAQVLSGVDINAAKRELEEANVIVQNSGDPLLINGFNKTRDQMKLSFEELENK